MQRDIVVIGASAGGVEALIKLVAKLPADLPAAVFVTHHFPSGTRSVLPILLGRAGPLQVRHPERRERIERGVIYVAPPDFHLTIEKDHVVLSPGPKENGHRPAIDTMFRSAAKSCGERVIGVILTGMLDDGVAGLLAIKSQGGLALVQDPQDAFSSSMPVTAIKRVSVDRVVPIAEMGEAITEVVCNGQIAKAEAMDHNTQELVREEMELGNPVAPIDGPDDVPGELTMYTCPECNGSLWELREDDVLRYRCHVGHSYTEDTFLVEKTDELESALWSALRALQEHAIILKSMSDKAEQRGHRYSAKRLLENYNDAERRAGVVREVLLHSPIFHAPASEHEAAL
jgi:two-component system, chemotaxis family, protein-glutamate methylesterase/glutaminase